MSWIDFALESILSRCESPIEEKFAKAWVEYCDEFWSEVQFSFTPETFVGNIPELTPATRLHPGRFDVVMQQVHIENYRVDFVLGRVENDLIESRNFEECLVRLPMIVVECDGHDFHERTKEQAARDKSRDRRLNQLGYRVLRFTGSEIWHDATKCAREVDALFTCLLRPEISASISAVGEHKNLDEIR